MGARGTSPIPGAFGPLLGRLAEPLYAAGLAWRNRRFDAGTGVRRVAVPVISIGNLSVGGTGKTPMVTWLVGELVRRGIKPAVAMRGYMPRGSAPYVNGSPQSDEAAEYRRTLPNTPLIVNPDRAAAIANVLSSSEGHGIDAIILDDGFQHRQLHRDLDIVLIDATRDPFADRLLPAGWLREPVAALHRAGAIVITHAEAVDEARARELESKLRAINPTALLARSRHEWSGLLDLHNAPLPTEWLRGKRVLVACAIGNPDPFLHAVEAAAIVGERVILRDHDSFSPATVIRIIAAARSSGAQAIVVTEKDWSKLTKVAPSRWPAPIVRPRLTIRFDRAESELLALALSALKPSKEP